MNEINQDNFRVEIATLAEDITIDKDAIKKTVTGKFRIPVLMTNDTVANVQTSNKNVLNRTNSSLKGSSMNLNNTISLTIPKEYIMCYKGSKIPKDSKFMVSFVSANVNDIKIIGRYGGDPEISNTEKKELTTQAANSKENVASTSGTSSDKSILEYILDCIENFEKRISTIEEQLGIESERIDQLFTKTDELKDTTDGLKTTTDDLANKTSSLEESNTAMNDRITSLEEQSQQTTPTDPAEGDDSGGVDQLPSDG